MSGMQGGGGGGGGEEAVARERIKCKRAARPENMSFPSWLKGK